MALSFVTSYRACTYREKSCYVDVRNISRCLKLTLGFAHKVSCFEESMIGILSILTHPGAHTAQSIVPSDAMGFFVVMLGC